MDYIAYLHKDAKSDFGVSFPDFPGCVTAGKTLEEARRMAVEALDLHVRGMLEDGEDIPEPSTLDDLAHDPALKRAVAVLIPLRAHEKTIRVNITARESQIDEIDRQARKAGLTRSAYIVQLATGRLAKSSVGRRSQESILTTKLRNRRDKDP
jgi:predicted RNase H-like HicB family nuclease